LRKHAFILILLGAGVFIAGCDPQLRKSDAELGLNPQQAAGRRVFDRHCGMCHEPYSSRNLKGPSLQAMFKKPYMVSGTPANDERVSEVVMLGRSKMPAFNQVLTQKQVEDLLAYLHTL
jgi:mono/diheme cytochrome c family protein